MHKITTQPSGDGHRSECSEGDFVSNEYPTAERAHEKGLNHKAAKDGSPNTQPGGSDDPRMRY